MLESGMEKKSRGKMVTVLARRDFAEEEKRSLPPAIIRDILQIAIAGVDWISGNPEASRVLY